MYWYFYLHCFNYFSIYESEGEFFALDGVEVFSCSTLFLAFIIFYFMKNKNVELRKNKWKILNTVNENSFFIYALHCLILELLLHFGISLDLFNYLGLGTILYTLCIIIFLIIIKKFIVDKIYFIKRFCEW